MTRRILLPLLALLGVLLLPGSATAVTPDVGQHLHVEVANHPVDGFPIARAPYTFHVTLREHDNPGKTKYLRIDDGSTTRAKRTVVMGPCTDCAVSFDWTVDFSGWSIGRHELRWHLDEEDADPATANSQRQYTTSRVQVCIASCSPNVGGRASNWHGGGSWYTGPGYVVALMLSPDANLRPGGSIVIRSQYSNAKACAYLNPAFHAGSHGLLLGCGSTGTATKTIAIPASAACGDKLVIAALGSQEAGVLDLRLCSSGPTAYAGFQSWWSTGGLTLP